MKPLGPYALSATNPQPITVDWEGLAQPPIGIDLKNISGLLCTANIGGQIVWLLPWTARFFPVSANINQCLVIPGNNLVPTNADPKKLIADVYQIGDNTPPANQDRSLTGLAAASTIEGSVQTYGAQIELTNSPAIPNNYGFTFFTWPAGSPAISDVSITLTPNLSMPGSSTAVNFVVQGQTTGKVYLRETVDHGEWILPISSLLEPDGISVSYGQVNGYPGQWGITLNVIGNVVSQFVRPVFGPGVSGPDTLSTALAISTSSPAVAGNGSRTNVVRIWNISLNGDNFGSAGATAFLSSTSAGVGTIFQLRIGPGQSNEDSVKYEGGIPLALYLNPLILTAPGNLEVIANIAYSTDCA